MFHYIYFTQIYFILLKTCEYYNIHDLQKLRKYISKYIVDTWNRYIWAILQGVSVQGFPKFSC